MSTFFFAIQLFASMTAAMGAYALVMSLSMKTHNTRWIRGESLLTLISAGIASGLVFHVLTDGGDSFMLVSVLLLMLGLANTLALTIATHMLFTSQEGPRRSLLTSLVNVLALVAVSAFTLHILLQFAALAGV